MDCFFIFSFFSLFLSFIFKEIFSVWDFFHNFSPSAPILCCLTTKIDIIDLCLYVGDSVVPHPEMQLLSLIEFLLDSGKFSTLCMKPVLRRHCSAWKQR